MFVVVVAFILTVKSGQYDDLDGPAHRILMDDDDPRIPSNQPVAKSSPENINNDNQMK
jgi:nitrogen fixation-related uncharacterized protein